MKNGSTFLKLAFTVTLALALAISFDCLAQTENETFTAKNAIYLEVGGSSGRYAVNYSKIFHQKGKLKLNASAGFSMWRNQLNDFKTIWLPVIPLEVQPYMASQTIIWNWVLGLLHT